MSLIGYDYSRAVTSIGPRSDADSPPTAAKSPGRSRRATVTACVALLLVTLVAVLTENVAADDGLATMDPIWLRWIITHRNGVLTPIAITVSDFGGTVAMSALACLVCAASAWHRRWRQTVLVASATIGAWLLVTVLKHLVRRPRPPIVDRLTVETSLSYPSGHSLGSIVVVGVVAVVLTSWLRRRSIRRVAAVVAVVAVVAVGLSRPYLGVHWPTDVLGGWSIGGLWLLLCLTVYRRNDSTPTDIAPLRSDFQ